MGFFDEILDWLTPFLTGSDRFLDKPIPDEGKWILETKSGSKYTLKKKDKKYIATKGKDIYEFQGTTYNKSLEKEAKAIKKLREILEQGLVLKNQVTKEMEFTTPVIEITKIEEINKEYITKPLPKNGKWMLYTTGDDKYLLVKTGKELYVMEGKRIFEIIETRLPNDKSDKEAKDIKILSDLLWRKLFLKNKTGNLPKTSSEIIDILEFE